MLAIDQILWIMQAEDASTMTDTNDKGSGKARGGHARAESLSKDERTEIAKRAAQARWEGPTVMATHGDADHPLQIGDADRT